MSVEWRVIVNICFFCFKIKEIMVLFNFILVDLCGLLVQVLYFSEKGDKLIGVYLEEGEDEINYSLYLWNIKGIRV